MIFKELKIKGVYVLQPKIVYDDRGSTVSVFYQKDLQEAGLNFDIVKINQTLTAKKGSIRGLHFQQEPYAEDKLVQCLEGSIFDVVVDLRKNSKTYGQSISQELSKENGKMLLVPKGCAHGFQTLIDNSKIQYLFSALYVPEAGSGLRFDDPWLNITWPLEATEISEKDKHWPLMEESNKSRI